MKVILCLAIFVAVASAAVINSRIIGGKEATPHQFPHMISLQWIENQEPTHFCGGALLNENFVLTAGHCVNAFSEDTEVVAGAHSIKHSNKNEQRRKPKNVYIHKDYAGDVAPHDIALIEVDQPFELNDFVKALNLPTQTKYPTGKATISGWGSISNTNSPNYPDKLRWAELPVLDEKKCHTGFPGTPMHETNICAGETNGSKAVCNGDSGSPLFQKDSQGKVVVYGVASWTWLPCGTPGKTGVFVNVSHYLQWIQNHMSKN
ncbi:trypsin [Sergentomyia squamirostris]